MVIWLPPKAHKRIEGKNKKLKNCLSTQVNFFPLFLPRVSAFCKYLIINAVNAGLGVFKFSGTCLKCCWSFTVLALYHFFFLVVTGEKIKDSLQVTEYILTVNRYCSIFASLGTDSLHGSLTMRCTSVQNSISHWFLTAASLPRTHCKEF